MTVNTPADKLVRAANLVLGGVPPKWGKSGFDLVLEFLVKLPEIRDGYATPHTTYLIYIVNSGDTSAMSFAQAAVNTKMAEGFLNHMGSLDDMTPVLATGDIEGFHREVEAFGDIEQAILKPHLGITPLYRYIAAFQNGLFPLVDTEMMNSAKLQLRTNPFLFFAYGQRMQTYMPLLWKDV